LVGDQRGATELNFSETNGLQHSGDCPMLSPPWSVPLVSGLAQPKCWAFLFCGAA
jgi:hypothetical protein